MSSHVALTRKEDSVVVIGGGKGITAIRAAKIVGQTGDITIFEGGNESIEEICTTSRMNEFSADLDIRHAVVGRERDVYWGDSTQASNVSPEELPECDVLELDCEGSEIDVLRGLSDRPRVIIMELHPYNYESHPLKPLELLSEYGYEVILRFGHNGMPINREELSTILLNRYEWGDNALNYNARPPAVVSAVHDESEPTH